MFSQKAGDNSERGHFIGVNLVVVAGMFFGLDVAVNAAVLVAQEE